MTSSYFLYSFAPRIGAIFFEEMSRLLVRQDVSIIAFCMGGHGFKSCRDPLNEVHSTKISIDFILRSSRSHSVNSIEKRSEISWGKIRRIWWTFDQINSSWFHLRFFRHVLWKITSDMVAGTSIGASLSLWLVGWMIFLPFLSY